jgi:hypothetical protein
VNNMLDFLYFLPFTLITLFSLGAVAWAVMDSREEERFFRDL